MADRAQTEKLFGKTLHEDGTLRAVSPSQVGTFKRCGLRWHFEKKGKLQKKPMGKGAAIGDKCHGHLDKFLKTGQDVRGALELVGSKMLEPYLWAAPFQKGPGISEGALLSPRLATPGGVLIAGYFDFYIPGLHGRESGFEWPTIIDHKFKKDLIKWGYYTGEAGAKFVASGAISEERLEVDEEKLKDDPQTIIYGGWARKKQPEADGVVVRQHQHQTEGEGGRFALPAEVRLTREDLLRRWGALAAEIDGPMVDASKVPAAGPGLTPDGVPFNDMACGDFGGCDFARTCKHSPSNRFATLLHGSGGRAIQAVTPSNGAPTMSLLTQVGLKPATPAASTPQTAEQTTALLKASVEATKPAVTGSVGHPDIPFMSTIALDALKPGVLYLITGGPAKFEALLGSRAIFRAKDGGLREAAAGDVVKTLDEETLCMFEGRPYQKPTPPAMVGANAAIEAATGQTVAQLDAAKVEKKRKLGIVDVTDPSPTTPPDVAPTVTNVINTAAPASTPAPEVKVTTAEALATTPEPEAKPEKPAKGGKKGATNVATVQPVEPVDPTKTEGGLFLVINGSCSKAVDLAAYVKKLADELATKHGTFDIRVARKESDLAFGGWKACLALEVAKNPPKGLCTIMSGELADPVIEALVPIATVVIRGTR